MLKSLNINIYNLREQGIECPTPVINRVTSKPYRVTTSESPRAYNLNIIALNCGDLFYILYDSFTNSSLLMLLCSFVKTPFGNYRLLYYRQKFRTKPITAYQFIIQKIFNARIILFPYLEEKTCFSIPLLFIFHYNTIGAL